jgi:hypothetical protein
MSESVSWEAASLMRQIKNLNWLYWGVAVGVGLK